MQYILMKLREYFGAILFILTVIICFLYYSHEIKIINEQYDQKQQVVESDKYER